MAVNKVVINTENGEQTLIDLTGDNVIAETLPEGVTAHGANGEIVAGAMPIKKTPKMYGAKGDGVTDDTAAFQTALAENRVVFVPGGTYKLSGELLIRGNCEIELCQDTVLDFSQTSGNCVSMEMSASIRGHHGLLKVPYTFAGNVINVTTALNQDVTAIDPWYRWDPQWKAGRYITDLNITKHDSKGFCYANQPGDCKGTAIYISADRNGTSANRSTFIWGLDFSGIRIAGAFSYGVRAVNYNEAWNHEMRISAFISNAEIGVSLEDCHNAYISAAIQPRYSENTSGAKTGVYAKHGIQLIRSTNADLSGSRVWDWNDNSTKWQNGNQWQHIGMYGDCHGAILNCFHYYDEASIDVRKQIYTDMPSNLEKLTILQEPFTRWFKPKNGEPYFYDGEAEKRIALKADLDNYFDTDSVKGYTDALSIATDQNGAIFNGIGYKLKWYINSSGVESATEQAYASTGFIPAVPGDVLYLKGLHFDTGLKYSDNGVKILYYNENKAFLLMQGCSNVMGSGGAQYNSGERTEDGMTITTKANLANEGNVRYVRFVFSTYDIGDNPIISVNDEIKYTQAGFLADSIKVKGETVVLTSPGGKSYLLSVDDNGTISATPAT